MKKIYLLVIAAPIFIFSCSKNPSSENTPTPITPTPTTPQTTTLSVTSISPSNGVYQDNIQINGTGFDVLPANNIVTINGVTVPVTIATTTILQIAVPLALGSGPVTVTVGGNKVTGPTFTYVSSEVMALFAGSGITSSDPVTHAIINVLTDGTGIAATFSSPLGLAVDAAGNIYVADQSNTAIRKISPAGVVTTLAGSNKVQGATNGTGSAASFNQPNSLAVDAAGNIYVCDGGNNLIRKVTAAGVVSTLAGGATIYTGVITNGTGTAASFNFPKAIAVDALGNVFVADYFNNAIRKITPAGVVTTFVSTGAYSPQGLAFDSSGNLYVCEVSSAYSSGNVFNYTSSFISKVTPAGVITTLAGSTISIGSADGTGTAATFNSPNGITVDASGNIYVADTNNRLIRKITTAGVVTTITGTTTVQTTIPAITTAITKANGTFINIPAGIVVDAAGNVYFSSGSVVEKAYIK